MPLGASPSLVACFCLNIIFGTYQLNIRKSRDHRPPWLFGSISLSHDFEWDFLLPFLGPHQKFWSKHIKCVTNRVRQLEHSHYFSAKGMSCSLNQRFIPILRQGVLPEQDSLVSLSCRFRNLPSCIRPSRVGRPKYFASNSCTWICNSRRISCWVPYGHDAPNWIEHLSGFISWPVALSYSKMDDPTLY